MTSLKKCTRPIPGACIVADSMPKIKKQVKRLQSKGYPVNNILDIIQNYDTFKKNSGLISESFRKCSGAVGDTDKILRVCRK